jgi:DNA-binding transcriptional MerR regulator
MHSSTAEARYHIGELASRSGITPDTVRYYERLRLLPRPPRTNGGFRVYTAETLERVRFIRQAQALGLTLHDIRELLGYQSALQDAHCVNWNHGGSKSVLRDSWNQVP